MTVCALNLTQNGSDLMYEVICTDEYVDTKIMLNLRFIALGAEHSMGLLFSVTRIFFFKLVVSNAFSFT